MAHRLALPSGSQVHDEFHVSLLRKHLGSSIPPSPEFPLVSDVSAILAQPKAVLDRRSILKGKYRPK